MTASHDHQNPSPLRPVHEWHGLKYPDEQLVRHFFKNGLHQKKGRVLELGCGNGVNLGLYAAHGWEVVGLDYDQASLAMARHNLGEAACLIEADLSESDWLDQVSGSFDALLLPSVFYYVPRSAMLAGLKALAPLMTRGAPCYWRMRLIDDARFGKGELIEPNGYRLSLKETGEFGAINVFYTKDELLTYAHDALGLCDIVPLRLRFDNIQNDQIIDNSELILWGRF